MLVSYNIAVFSVVRVGERGPRTFRPCVGRLEAHLLLDDGRHLLRTQHAVAVFVQLVEARRNLLVAITHTHGRNVRWPRSVRH